MIDFSKKSQTLKFFDSIMDELKTSKIKAIFSLTPPFWNHNDDFRTYISDTEVYVMLENGMCLVIEYYFVDELELQFRKLTTEEETQYRNMSRKDFFNSLGKIHNSHTKEIIQVENCELEYDCINSISLKSVTEKYNKWIDNGIDYVTPTNETFDEIKFTMNNGKSFSFCAADAEMDGYVLVWSNDATETITKI